MIKEPTDEQKRIIEHQGNVVITAKPGSGKTYTVVEMIARIIPQLPEYKGIIAISFTNKASDELKKRCKLRCTETKQSFFGTIDKFYISQIIIPFAGHITQVVSDYEIINELPNYGKYAKLSNVQGKLSDYEKSLLIDGLREGKIFLKFTGETALIILNKATGVLKYIKSRYSHIIIDEYQDCGEIQHTIFTKLVDNGLIGIAVGDINQAIYGFTNRFPKFLLSLIGREGFEHFELNKNYRCHIGIAEYSLCIFNASKIIPEEKRVFRVSVEGSEHQIAAQIDSHLDLIKKKYSVINNKQIAILCKSNASIFKISENLLVPHKVFEETVLDRDNTDWGRFFRSVLSSRFEENFYASDYAEELFSKEYEPIKYRSALTLCQKIFSLPASNMRYAENEIVALAELVYPQGRNNSALSKLHDVLNNFKVLQNFIPASNDEVNIMTLHKSKGLEFNIVFHMDMYKWLFPNEYGSEDARLQDLNLHYVGITRAKDVCYIMNGTKRFSSNKGNYCSADPSPFLYLKGLTERRYDVLWK